MSDKQNFNLLSFLSKTIQCQIKSNLIQSNKTDICCCYPQVYFYFSIWPSKVCLMQTNKPNKRPILCVEIFACFSKQTNKLSHRQFVCFIFICLFVSLSSSDSKATIFKEEMNLFLSLSLLQVCLLHNNQIKSLLKMHLLCVKSDSQQTIGFPSEIKTFSTSSKVVVI